MAAVSKEQTQNQHWKSQEVKLVNGQPVCFSDVCVHEFFVADSEDPVLYAADPLYQWQQSEPGQWVMTNAVETPYWIQSIDHTSYSIRFKIMARLSKPNQTFWRLKWGTK